MKKLSLVLSLVLFSIGAMTAQRNVSGTVTDAGGEALIGASVLVKGTTTGSITDVDGRYSVSVPDGSTVLVFSYTGFETQEVSLGASNTVDVVLSEGLALTEVVVTGLGIRKEKKALGYAVSTIGSADLELRPEADVARTLRGKVPGVNITSTSGLAGSGTNIIIRGYSSITGDNQPLFVVDGVPFNSSTSTDQSFASGGATASSRFLDLDPNNIAEVSILKGLSATVLYGEAGRNGVVLVTTKNGMSADMNKKFEVTVDQSYYVSEIASLPEDQDNYGNGWQNFASAAFSNWGAPFDQPNKNGLTDGTIRHPYDRAALNDVFPEYVGARYDYKAYDNLQNFFTNGAIQNTSVGITSRVGKGTSINANYGYNSDRAFVETSNYKKHNLGLGVNTELANGIKMTTSLNFVNSDRNAPPAAPIYSSNPISGVSLFSNVLYTPRSVGLFELEYENPVDKSSIFYRGGNDIQHPLWTLRNSNNNEKINRFFGNTQLSYAINDNFMLNYRIGIDAYEQKYTYYVNKGGRQAPDGFMNTSNRRNTIVDQNANLNYDFNINDDLNLSGVLGVNLRRDVFERATVNSTQQFVYGLLTHNNFINHVGTSYFQEENTIGAYLTATLGFRNYLYLNIQGRNDWTSTLEEANRSILYPSASLSFIATEAIDGLRNNKVLNYLKLRGGYGTSAGYPSPYRTRNTLSTVANEFNTASGTVINYNSVSNVFGNPELRPELHAELEFGVEAKMFDNRVGIDFSWYDKQSTDLIIDLPLESSTGYLETTLNTASVSNTGIELGLNFVPVRTDDLLWTVGINYTANENIVESLAEGVEQAPIAGFSFLGNYAIPGEPYGVLWGSQIARNDAGVPILNGSGTYQYAQDGIIGDPNADYRLNGFTSVSWKGLSFRAQIDYTKGGQMWASTPSTLMGRGILEETGYDRFIPVVVDGVDADGNPNTIQITPNRHHWENMGVFYDENRIFDATVIRLREVSLSYALPSKWLENTPFGSASVTFAGQNLWFKSPNVPVSANFDPEVSSLGVGNGQGFDYVTGPTSKMYGGSVRFTF